MRWRVAPLRSIFYPIQTNFMQGCFMRFSLSLASMCRTTATKAHKASLLLCCALGLGFAPSFTPALARNVTDMSGTVVTVPDTPTAIADLWFAHNEILVMLGAAAKIKVTAENPKDSPWLFKVAPVLLSARTGVRPESANPEDLLARKIDLVFVPQRATAETLRHASLPTLDAHYATLPDMLRSLDMTAQALGTPEAHSTAYLYRSQMEHMLALLQSRTAPLPATARPRVLHIARLNPLQIDGTNTLIDSWITAAGGQNAATVSGNHKPTTFEQIAAWNPDLIILGATAGLPAQDAPLRSLPAFAKGHWAVNPQGVFSWDRYGCEELLQLEWAAKLFHPTLFTDLDLPHDVQAFYRTFFHYTLNDDDTARILAARPPAP